MRRATILFAMLLPALLLMAVTAVQARRQSRPWQRALVAYASLNGPSASTPLSVQIVEQAEVPQQFSLELSGSVLGSNPVLSCEWQLHGSIAAERPAPGALPARWPMVRTSRASKCPGSWFWQTGNQQHHLRGRAPGPLQWRHPYPRGGRKTEYCGDPASATKSRL